MFVSVDGKSREVTEIFAGGTDGKAHRITELFGSVDGVAKQIYTIEKEINSFDLFTWEEIKDLANAGKLLEHFNLYDRVVIKLKEPLRNEMNIYMQGYGKYVKVPQVQDEMILQIAELTATKMRLVSTRVSVLGTASSTIGRGSTSGSGANAIYSGSYQGNSSTRNLVSQAWGLTPMYKALKTIDNSLPDDFRNALSICTRPLIDYTRHSITNALQSTFDDDMRTRQITSTTNRISLDTSREDIFYPIPGNADFPSSVTDYLYYIRLPEEYDTFEQRRRMVSSMFKGFAYMDHKNKSTYYGGSYEYYIMQTFSSIPYKMCYYTKMGITTNKEYEDYNNTPGGNDYEGTSASYSCNTIFPEFIIAADSENVIK